MRLAQHIEQKLHYAFAAESVEIIDDSARHAGHAGWREGGETHFKVVIVASFFSGMSRLARHRAVYDCVREEMAERVHALTIVAKTPQEAGLAEE